MNFVMIVVPATNHNKINFLLANTSSSSTVPLPAILLEDPDDENGGSSNNATAATLSSSIVNTTDVVVGGEVAVSLPRNDIHHIKLEQRAADANVADGDKKKRTRKQRTVISPLEDLVCRGACGSGSDCISSKNKQASDNTASEKVQPLEFLRCENFEGDIKCPLWIGSACALKHNNFKCRLCSLLDAPPQDDMWNRYVKNFNIYLYLLN